MSIKAVVFDIGGVLEITPDRGITQKWEALLHLAPGKLNERVADVWLAGSLGNCSEEEVHRDLCAHLDLTETQVEAFMQDIWEEYLGMPNLPLLAYFSSLRPRYRTALLSNSFVGARAREEERYHFAEMTDLIIYSHEVGVAKPERRIFEITCERLGIQPEEVVFLDDVEKNVNAALSFGMHALRLVDTDRAIEAIQKVLQL